MLSVADLSCIRGDRTLFRGVSFTLEAGQCLHLEGGNGVGKTSLLRIVAGLSPAAQGEVRWHGALLGSPHCQLPAQMLYLGHLLALKDELSAVENLISGGAIAGSGPNQEQALDALKQLGLAGRTALPVRVLSQGQKRRVALARLLLQQHPLWVLDEPFVALDAAAHALIVRVLHGHLAQGGMVLLTSHQPVDMGTQGRSLRLDA
ncbi:MAG: cytochrome c biogenesis heme-transporting ATPase CcmA [Betaproteobacteria bacterium]